MSHLRYPRTQYPGFDPVEAASKTLDDYATLFTEIRKEEVALAKARHVRVKGVMTKELKGPGPPHVTKLDLARAHAKAAGLTLPDYFEEQKKDDARAGAVHQTAWRLQA